MRGGPGTGKSFVVEKIRQDLFEQEMGWTRGACFQAVALEATSASALGGDAIRSALGMGANDAKGQNAEDSGDADSRKKTKTDEAA